MTAVTTSGVVAKPGYAVGSLASWEDEEKTRWILVPTGSNVTALKLVGNALQPGWTSKEFIAPVTPTIVNGVVFAASAGNAKGAKAVLYAMEGMTGKELWNSGNTLGSYITTGGLAAGGGRVYVSTVDGTQYAFGFYMEH
jgi:outer membrane protein assembly factor BamB